MTRILYTLCGADRNRRFSPYAFRAFMALHHKGLDFREVPTQYAEIPAIEDGFTPTVPVLNDNGHLVRDSFDIALYLERAYPDRPSLFGGPSGPALCRTIEGYVQFILQASMMRMIVKDIHDILDPADQAYFRETREKRLGRTLEELVAGRDGEYAAFGPKLEPLRHALKHQPWFGGDGPLFADYIVFGAFAWARAVSTLPLLAPGDIVHDWFERCLGLHEGAFRAIPLA